MSEKKYICNQEVLDQALVDHKKVLADLKVVLDNAKKLKTRVENCDAWQGKQKTEFLGLLELIIEYHKDIVGSGKKAKEPYDKFIKSMEDLKKHINEYSTTSDSYKRLKNYD